MPKHPVNTILGFDFGLKRIGVAVGQTLTKTASPLTVIPAKDGIPEWSTVLKLIASWQPHALVVGLPLDGQSQPYALTHCALKFGHRLQEKTKLPVHFVDEILTTKTAKRFIAEGASDHAVDSAAASLILEDWFAQ